MRSQNLLPALGLTKSTSELQWNLFSSLTSYYRKKHSLYISQEKQGLGTLRQAQCIAGDWGHFDKLSASLGTGDWVRIFPITNYQLPIINYTRYTVPSQGATTLRA
ncbi:MAG: hypothetical protein ACKPBV_05150, partial [Sphaerospermopsis kisseleviana]